MSTTLANILTSISQRLGEDSEPSGNEKLRRVQFINEGGKSIVRKHYWWWTEETATFDSVADQASYTSTDGLPANIRGSAILEVRFDDTLYTPTLQTDVFSMTNSDYSGLAQEYFFFDNTLFISPAYGTSTTDGVAMKYYKTWTTLSSDSDVCDIPDDYADILVAFALGRIYTISGKRGSAADVYDEYDEIYKDMSYEQNNYLFALKSNESSEYALYD